LRFPGIDDCNTVGDDGHARYPTHASSIDIFGRKMETAMDYRFGTWPAKRWDGRAYPKNT
jgi:hypothetical protein